MKKTVRSKKWKHLLAVVLLFALALGMFPAFAAYFDRSPFTNRTPPLIINTNRKNSAPIRIFTK